jgi:hypothetical protein
LNNGYSGPFYAGSRIEGFAFISYMGVGIMARSVSFIGWLA